MKFIGYFFAAILTGFVLIVHGRPSRRSVNDPSDDSEPPTQGPEELGIYHQGDMIFPPTPRGVGDRPAYQRWPNGTVPYDMTSSISANNSALIIQAMRKMENLTQVSGAPCISFRPKVVGDVYYITIQNGSGCSATVGAWIGYSVNHVLNLFDSPASGTCMITGTIQHELLHILGFYHEQSRPDRDSYVSIQWSNIQSSSAFNFDKFNATDVDTLMTSYDYGSVMHYGRTSFSMNGNDTIVPTQNTSAFIGQRVGMSPVDVLEVQRYYGCVATPTSTTTTITSTNATTATSTVSSLLNTTSTLSTTTNATSANSQDLNSGQNKSIPDTFIYVWWLISMIYFRMKFISH